MAYFTAVFTASERQHELSCLTQLRLVSWSIYDL